MRGIRVAVAVSLLAACAGDDGEAGPPGPPGAAGVTVDTNRFCSVISGGVLLSYQVVEFSSGDALALCSISDNASTYSGHVFYRAGQVGAVTGLCLMAYDLDTFSGGYWEFRRDGGEHAVYHDTGSAFDGTTVLFPAANCI